MTVQGPPERVQHAFQPAQHPSDHSIACCPKPAGYYYLVKTPLTLSMGGPSTSAQCCIVSWADRLFEARRLRVNIDRLHPAIGWMPVHLCWCSQKELKGLFPGASYFKQFLHDSGVGTSTGIAIRASSLSAANSLLMKHESGHRRHRLARCCLSDNHQTIVSKGVKSRSTLVQII